MLKSLIKSAASFIAPHTTAAVAAARARAYSHRLVKDWGLDEINQRLMREIGNVVISGPFKGLILTPMACEGHVGPYLLGTYEMELHPWWEQLFQRRFRQIVNVGTNFGYYAVGLAGKFPDAAVSAFDTDGWARQATAEMARANRVTGISIEAFCNAAWLTQNLRNDVLVVSDCEGYERQLFCTDEIPPLARAAMIIELHESVAPGVSGEMLARFSATHAIAQVHSRQITPAPNLVLHSLTEAEVRRASTEVRPQQTWMLLTPLNR